MARGKTPFERAMALAAISGLKVALGPAFLSASRRGPNARTWAMAALGEMFLDKVGIFPPRYRPALLIPHAIAGAWVAQGEHEAGRCRGPHGADPGCRGGRRRVRVAPMARITLNKGLGISDALLGVAEDYLALRLGTEATGMTMNQVSEVAQDAFGELRGQVMQSLPSNSDSSRQAKAAAVR